MFECHVLERWLACRRALYIRILLFTSLSFDACDENQNQEKRDDVRSISRTNKAVLN
jgi:hypothetical protein